MSMMGPVVDMLLHLPERNLARREEGSKRISTIREMMQSTGKYRNKTS